MPLTGYITIWQYPQDHGAASWFRSVPEAIAHGTWQWREADPSVDQVAVIDLATLTIVWSPETVPALTLSAQPHETS